MHGSGLEWTSLVLSHQRNMFKGGITTFVLCVLQLVTLATAAQHAAVVSGASGVSSDTWIGLESVNSVPTTSRPNLGWLRRGTPPQIPTCGLRTSPTTLGAGKESVLNNVAEATVMVGATSIPCFVSCKFLWLASMVLCLASSCSLPAWFWCSQQMKHISRSMYTWCTGITMTSWYGQYVLSQIRELDIC